jgi:hypothetical protein
MTEGVGVGAGVGEGVAVGLGVAVGEGVTVAVGDGDGVGVGFLLAAAEGTVIKKPTASDAANTNRLEAVGPVLDENVDLGIVFSLQLIVVSGRRRRSGRRRWCRNWGGRCSWGRS